MQAPAAAPSRVRALMTGESVQRLLALGALLILLVFFSVVVPHFASTANYIDILTATSVNGVLAVGVTLVIITGGIDLSVGTAMTFCSVVAGLVSVTLGLPLPLGLLSAFAAGAAVGLVNGSLVAKAKLPPFIATLGMLYVTLGLAQVISNVHPIYFDAAQPQFQIFFMSKAVFGIPNIVWVMLGAAAIAWVLLNKTTFGRYTFALGSNEEATRISGVNVDRWKITVYVVEGLFVGLAGIIIASRMNSAQPCLGVGYELDAIAAAVIGGTSLMGGVGTIPGAMVGALLLASIDNGMNLNNVNSFLQQVVKGLILLIAVAIDQWANRRQRRA